MSPVVTLAQGAPPIEQSGTSYMVQYGVVGIMCVVFAYIIFYLYRENRVDRREAASNEKNHAAELTACKEQCKTEKEALRADYERRYRELLEGYQAQLVQIRTASDQREDSIRRDMSTMIEKLANSNKESSEALVDMLTQFLQKVVK